MPLPSQTEITIVTTGEPRGKERHRTIKTTGRTYTPPKTVAAQARVRDAWLEAGGLHLGTGPLSAALTVVMARPASHKRVRGGLTALGVRSWAPTKKPDADNVLKLQLDALNECAFRDDSQIVRAIVVKRWAAEDEREHTRLTLTQIPVPADVAAAVVVLDAARAARTSPTLQDDCTAAADAGREQQEAAA